MKRYESGAAKRKRQEEKSHRVEAEISTYPKINTFFLQPEKSVEKPNQDTLTPIAPSNNVSLDDVSEEPCCDNPTNIQEYNDCDKIAKSNYLSDPALWRVDEQMVKFWVENGPRQNKDADFSLSVREYKDGDRKIRRFLPSNVFKRVLSNGQIVDRDYTLLLLENYSVLLAYYFPKMTLEPHVLMLVVTTTGSMFTSL